MKEEQVKMDRNYAINFPKKYNRSILFDKCKQIIKFYGKFISVNFRKNMTIMIYLLKSYSSNNQNIYGIIKNKINKHKFKLSNYKDVTYPFYFKESSMSLLVLKNAVNKFNKRLDLEFTIARIIEEIMIDFLEKVGIKIK